MLWRIVNVNNDGTVKLISEDITNNLRYTEDKYKDSNIDKWLNNVFLPSITSSDYLVESEYCVGNIASINDYNNSCNEKIKSKVGLLSIDEYSKTYVNNFSSTNYKNNLNYAFSNKNNDMVVMVNQLRIIDSYDDLTLVPIKPVITLKSNIYITSGDGTKNSPYKLEDYNYGKENDKINTRIVGEYLKYSDITFRIIDKVEDNVKIIMAEPFMNSTTNLPLVIDISNIENYQFNITTENNPGYVINNNYIDYIKESNLISSKYNIITNKSDTTYDKFEKESIKTKLMLASTTDLFSGLNASLSNNYKRIQLFADRTTSNTVIMLNVISGVSFEIPTNTYGEYAFKVLTVMNGNLKIKSGNGTVNNPYILK